MAEYINRNELVENLDRFAPEHLTPLIRTLIEKQPTADVVEVVRCEKCKYFESHGNGKAGICRNKKLKPCLRYATDYCSYGEQKFETDTNVGSK